MKRIWIGLLSIMLLAPVVLSAANWHNLTDGGHCLQIAGFTDSFCFENDGDIVIDDGVTDAPTLTFKDATDETLVFTKLDGSHFTATITAADAFQVLTGNLRVGNGTPGETINGEDLYVEGISEFDGTANFDGAVDMASTLAMGGALTVGASGTLDLNGVADALVIDADADTTISAPTDDQVDFEINGADDFTMTANAFNVLSGSDLNIASGATGTFTGNVTATGTMTLNGAVTHGSTVASSGNAVDMTLNVPTNGGNANAKNEYVGIPRIAGFATGTGTNGTAASKTVTGYIDETPAGEWTATANITSNTDATEYRKGTASLELVVGATPAADNGADNTLSGGDEDWSADESFGFWHMCSVTTTAGDWVLEITDSVAGATDVNVPALTSANVWTWVEVDISGVADASKDVIQSIAFDLSAAGATALVSDTCNFDYAYKWDATEEDAMSIDVLTDGVIAVYKVLTAAAGVNDVSMAAEGTDYFVHYETGNFLVWITDQSANALWGFAALE